MHPLRRRLSRSGPMIALLLVTVLMTVFVASRLVASPVRPDRPLLVASGDWEPFVGPGLPAGGPVAELVREVLARQGFSAQIGYTTWELALQRVDQGVVAGAFPYVGSQARREDYLLSDPLMRFEYRLFVRRDDVDSWSTEASLAHARVARIEGYDYWPELDEAVAEYAEYETKEAAFAALVAGEVDVVPEGDLSGRAVLAAPDFPADAREVVSLDPDLGAAFGSEESLYFMVPPGSANEAFLADFNARLAEVLADEHYRDLGARLGSPADVVVRLGAASGASAMLRDVRTGAVVRVLNGVRAVVRGWPEEFDAMPAVEGRRLWVKLLDGPHAGRLLSARPRDVEVVRSDGS